MFHSIRGDIEGAIASNYTYLKIRNLGSEDEEIYHKYQRNADFWRLINYSLQTTFFIAFGRIFDRRRDTFSVQDLVEATMEHPGFFSRDQLRARKRRDAQVAGKDPEWLLGYLASSWEPTRSDLACLESALSPHVSKFEQIYQHIRHAYFAHRGRAAEEVVSGLFSQTRIGDVEEILRFLYTLIDSIQEMASNGTRLDLGNTGAYERQVARASKDAEIFIRGLP